MKRLMSVLATAIFLVAMLLGSTAYAGDFVMTDWKWRQDTWSCTHNLPCSIEISGVVSNISGRTIKTPEIYVIARDGEGRFLGTDSTYIRPIGSFKPGAIGTFTVWIDTGIVSSVQITYQIK